MARSRRRRDDVSWSAATACYTAPSRAMTITAEARGRRYRALQTGCQSPPYSTRSEQTRHLARLDPMKALRRNAFAANSPTPSGFASAQTTFDELRCTWQFLGELTAPAVRGQPDTSRSIRTHTRHAHDTPV